MFMCSVRHLILEGTIGPVLKLVFAGSLLLSGVSNLHAQQSSIKVGEADLLPSVRVDYFSLDNAFRSSENEVDATGVSVAPSAVLVANRKGLEIEAGYNGMFASYSEDELNFDDHTIYGTVAAVISKRKRLFGSASISLGHEPLGTNFTEGDAIPGSEQVENAKFDARLSYRYGAPTARINLTGGLGLNSLTYRNREDLTDGRDYFSVNPFANLSYRLSADTRALLELRVRNVTYDNSLLDRNEIELLTGLSFRGTGKTGGNALIGVSSSSYSDGGREDDSVLAVDIGLYYLPTTFSRIDLKARRAFNDQDGVNLQASSTQTVDDVASVRWRNQWSGFVSSTASLTLQTKNRDCPTASTQTLSAGVQVAVKPRRWIELGTGFSSTDRTADSCTGEDSSGLDYGFQRISVFLNISL